MLIVLAVLVAAGAVGMVLVAKKSAIFPNVSVCGTDVGGMTQSAAADAIRAAGHPTATAIIVTDGAGDEVKMLAEGDVAPGTPLFKV